MCKNRLQNEDASDKIHPNYWKGYDCMNRVLKKISGFALAAVLLFSCACATEKTQDPANSAEPSPAPATAQKETIDYLKALGSVEFTKAKNVILFIGDGMSMYHIAATDAIAGGKYDGKLAIEYMTNQGTAVTICNEGEPDSASGGTALACGYKSNRKFLGLDRKQNEVQSVVELAKSLGKKAGVVTNESIVDATPAAFTIHAPNRNDESKIAKLQIENSVADIIIGGGKAMYDKALKDESYRKMLTDNHITLADTWEQVEAYQNEGRLIATLTDDYFGKAEEAVPTLAQMTEKALSLLSGTDEGFFLMVEGGAMDESAHESDIIELTKQMLAFDDAVSLGLRFASEHPDTIVIVTADHDTGGLKPKEVADPFVAAHKNETHTKAMLDFEKEHQKTYSEIDLSALPYRFTTIAHTNDKVQVFAVGYGTEIFHDTEVKSFEIGKFIGRAIGDENFGAQNKNGLK